MEWWKSLDGRKVLHGRMMQHESRTVLGNPVNARELFLRNECLEFELQDCQVLVFKFQLLLFLLLTLLVPPATVCCEGICLILR